MSPQPPENADVAVVGGGLIGLAVAHELLKRGRQVLLLDREGPGAGATRVAPGMLAPTSEADLERKILIDFALESLRRYPAFVAELAAETGLECRYRTDGTLWVALNRDEDAELDHLREMQQEKGLASRRLGPAELRELEPHLTPRLVGGLLVEEDLQVDPRALVPALTAAIEKRGGSIVCPARVTGIARDAAGLAVRGVAGGEFAVRCAAVVLAAGAWATAEIQAPIRGFQVRPVKGQLVRLRGPVLLRHTLRTPRVYVVPRDDGELLIGSTMEEMGFDASPTGGAVMDLLRHAWLLVPGLYDLALTETAAGFRPTVEDHLPVIGPSGTEGLYLALGHFRNGILLAPATAYYLAEWLTSGAAPGALAPFAPARFAPRS